MSPSLRSAVSLVTALALLVQVTGVAEAAPAGTDPPAPQALPPPPLPAPIAPVPAPGPVVVVPVAPAGVLVHLTPGKKDTLLETLYLSPRERWEPVCHAPCDVAVSPSESYRVRERGMLPSEPFELIASPGQRVVVRATGGGTTAGHAVGWALTGTGIGGSVIGSILLLAGGASNGSSTSTCVHGGFCPSGGSGSGASTTVAGAVVLGVGLVSLGVGILLLVSNGTPATSQAIGGALAPGSGRPADAWLRLPDGAGPAREATASLPRATTMPLLSRSF